MNSTFFLPRKAQHHISGFIRSLYKKNCLMASFRIYTCKTNLTTDLSEFKTISGDLLGSLSWKFAKTNRKFVFLVLEVKSLVLFFPCELMISVASLWFVDMLNFSLSTINMLQRVLLESCNCSTGFINRIRADEGQTGYKVESKTFGGNWCLTTVRLGHILWSFLIQNPCRKMYI